MKQKFLFLLIFHLLQSPFGALAQDFARIDEQARQTGAPAGHSVKTLATALSENCGTETEKARAFFVWIADNIRHDVKSFEKRIAASVYKISKKTDKKRDFLGCPVLL